MNILNVGYDSTNFYVLGTGPSRLMIDVGWPGTLPKLLGVLKRKGMALSDIGYLLVTHYHPDHAGLAQELKLKGVRLIVLEQQIAAIPKLKQYMKPVNPYVEIVMHDNLRISAGDSRVFLRRLGVAGEIVGTPGHSDDSVTLVLDEGAAFTGDLPPPGFAEEAASAAVEQSWATLRALGARTIYPGHAPAWPLPPG